MEVDPTSIGETGGSGENANEESLVDALIESQADDASKKQKAELDREIFNVKAELEEMTDKYLSVSRLNAEAKEEYEGIARQFEERLRLFRDLQVTNESLLTQKGAIDEQCLTLKRERDEKDLLLKKVNKEKHLVSMEVQALKEQLRDLSAQKKELEMQRRVMEKAQHDAKMECQRAMDEKAVYEESKRWFMNELTDRDNKIAQLRLETSGKEVSWQNERLRLVGDKTAAMNEVEDIKIDLELKQRLLDEVNEKLRGIGESHDAQLSTLKEEVSSRECLIRTLKEQINRADEASNEMKRLYDSTAALLESAKEEIEGARVETASQIEEATRIIEEREKEKNELKDELEKANELIKNKHNLTLSDEAIEELSPAAAVASRLIKSGGSLTAIYREHAKLAAQLEEERAKSRLTEESFQEVIGQLTERAPQLIQQKEQLEKYMDESYRLESQLKSAESQRKKLVEQRDEACSKLAFTQGELQKVQRDSKILEDKIAQLVFALEKERTKGGRMTPGADDENEDGDRQMFMDIKSLTKMNLQLESELNTQREKAHQMTLDKIEEEEAKLSNDRNAMQRELEMQKNHCAKLESALAGKQQALESYKNIVEGGGLGGESVITKRQLEQAMIELTEANVKIGRLAEWRESEKEAHDKMIVVYEDRINQHIAIVNEVKKSNGKMESDLQLQKQTALETYKELEKRTRQMERVVEAENKAREQIIALEQRMTGLHEKLMEMQAEVSSMRVEKRSLSEELRMAESNVMRLKAEVEVRVNNADHHDMMMRMYAEMETRVNAVETSKKEVMEMRVESLENERDQLKTSNAALAERNERLERERGADVAKLTGDKTDLEAKLEMEKSERISAENLANELRAKLVATQQHFTAVDASIGSNPERLAQECQKLKNENKFLEGQMEELKKREELATTAATKATEELAKLTDLSSTVESTLLDTTKAGSLEQERLQGLLEAETIKSTNLSSEVAKLREFITTLENSARNAKNLSDSSILEFAQKVSVLEMQLREESAKGLGFDERIKSVTDEKDGVMTQLETLRDELMVVKTELQEVTLEKENAEQQRTTLEGTIAAMESRQAEEASGWMDEKMRMEGEAKRAEREAEERKSRYEEEMKRKEEQINAMMTMAGEAGGSSMEVEGVNQMSAVNHYLREEQKRATERMMRAEVEMKRIKVQYDELEGERLKLEKRIKEMEVKSEKDGASLRDMAELRSKLDRSMGVEKELGVVKEEKEKMSKTVNELNRKLVLISGEKTKMMGELKSLKETSEKMSGEKTRDSLVWRKSLGEKEAELAKLRAELAAAKKSAETGGVGMGAGGRQLLQMKNQLETANKELTAAKAAAEKDLEAANNKIVQLRNLTIKYKKQAQGEGGSVASMGDLEGGAADQGLKLKLDETEAARAALESERDEIKFRLSSISSMFEKAKQQKDKLADENREMRKQLESMGVQLEGAGVVSQSASQSTSPVKSQLSPSSPVKSTIPPSISSTVITQSTLPPLPTPSLVQSTTPQKVEAAASPQKMLPVPALSIVSGGGTESSSVVPSDPTGPAPTVAPALSSLQPLAGIPSVPPTQSTNLFGSGSIDWPSKMGGAAGGAPSVAAGSSAPSASAASTWNAPSSSSSALKHAALFGRSARVTHVSTSSSHPEEWKVEEEQPISSSSSSVDTSRKRGANDERAEMKRARVEMVEEEEEDDGDNDVITSSHRGEDVEDLMMEDDTRDGDGEDDGGKKEEEGEGEEGEIEEEAGEVEVEVEAEGDEGDSQMGANMPLLHQEQMMGEEESREVGVDEEDEEREGEGEGEGEEEGVMVVNEEEDEDGSQRDDELDEVDGGEVRRRRMLIDEDEGNENEEEEIDDEDEEDEDEEEEDAVNDDVIDVSDDEEDEEGEDEEEEEEEEMDRDSESDGEVEVEGEGGEEGREAVASVDEAEEECDSAMASERGGEESEAMQSQTIEGGERTAKKKSPIRWDKAPEAMEECSSSNESASRPSTSAGGGGGGGSVVRGGRGSTGRQRGGLRGSAVSPRGAVRLPRGGAARPPRDHDMAMTLMRLGRGGGGSHRGKRGGREGQGGAAGGI